MDKSELKSIMAKVEKEGAIFSKKSSLNTLTTALPKRIIGRKSQTEQLVRHLLGYKQGHIVPVISIYGRSGTGKSTLVRFVCQNISDILVCFTNLRKAKTVFGAANLILAELGQTNLKSAQGMNQAIETIKNTIIRMMQDKQKKLFVLALDEFDVLFYDKRGNPSDFVYKLVEMQAELGDRGCLACIITISNNVLADYDLDDRIRSRIGTTEIFFEPYSKKDVLEILHQRAKDAFGKKIPENVLEYCAKLSYLEHGDARRAVDLLRVAAELASLKDETITTSHVDSASDQIQKDRVENVISSISYHSQLALLILAMKTYGLEQDWHSTSALYEKYKTFLEKGIKSVTNRRFSELLKDLDNTGIVESVTQSKGRQGYGSEFKLCVLPETIGNICAKKWWDENVVKKKKQQQNLASMSKPKRGDMFYDLYKKLDKMNSNTW